MGKRAKPVGLPLVSLSAVNSLAPQPADLAKRPCVNTSYGVVNASLNSRLRDETVDSASMRPWLAARKDTAVCNFTRKARKPQDGGIWSNEQCDRALIELQRDYTAISSKGPHNSLLRTWESMHRRMNNGATNYYPLTPDKVARVAAAFKGCGYRSFANYLCRAKEMHIQLGGEWGIELQFEAKRAVRSVNRGIGPVQQRLPFDVDKVLSYLKGKQFDATPIVAHGPVGPHALIVLGCFFMLREAEASLLLAQNVTLDDEAQQVTIKLPSSKTDPSAASVNRTWGCLCRSHGLESCPFHLAVYQMRTLTHRFGFQGHDLCLPFFPDGNGATVDKIRVVDTLERYHVLVGSPTLDEDGYRQLGGHSLRLAGSRLLASSGLHVYQIELMARWKSPMILHYAQTAPLTRITQEMSDTVARRSIADQLDILKEEMKNLRNQASREPLAPEFLQRVERLEGKLSGLDDRTNGMIREQVGLIRLKLLDKPCEFVKNLSTGTWHAVVQDGLGHAPMLWSTVCGWKFAFSQFVRSNSIPQQHSRRCDKCFHLKDGDSDSSSTDSSSN